MENAQVSVIMGSQSDWEIMAEATKILENFRISYEKKIISAHRTPARLFDYATKAHHRQIKVIIAGAGGAAHLPGMVASMTILPVLGVPIPSRNLSGLDSLLSIVQMPGGIPVGTLAIGSAGAKNAALLALSILALSDQALRDQLSIWREQQSLSVAEEPQDYGTSLHDH
jgi:5-(carboxyamino)imidazole ribonucleotide mutase